MDGADSDASAGSGAGWPRIVGDFFDTTTLFSVGSMRLSGLIAGAGVGHSMDKTVVIERLVDTKGADQKAGHALESDRFRDGEVVKKTRPRGRR
jgi:hypothetical protein